MPSKLIAFFHCFWFHEAEMSLVWQTGVFREVRRWLFYFEFVLLESNLSFVSVDVKRISIRGPLFVFAESRHKTSTLPLSTRVRSSRLPRVLRVFRRLSPATSKVACTSKIWRLFYWFSLFSYFPRFLTLPSAFFEPMFFYVLWKFSHILPFSLHLLKNFAVFIEHYLDSLLGESRTT